MRAVPTLALALGLALAACADFPELEAANRGLAPAGAPPPLLPYDQLAAATTFRAEGPEPLERLDARVAALRARAAVLRQPLSEPGDIDELRARLARLR